MKRHEIYTWTLLAVLLLSAGVALAAPKNGAPGDITECGAVLTEPGNYKLANDLLDCPGHGVKIQGSDITLNLMGHEISCEWIGVFVLGTEESTVKNVTVKNGRVSNCGDGVGLWFAEDTKVMHMTSMSNLEYGIAVWQSGNNVIMHNHVEGNAEDGIFSWESSGNVFKYNTSLGNGDGWIGAGIGLSNERNSKIMCNRVSGNADGILMHDDSSGNLLRGNLVTGNVNGIGMVGYYWQDPDTADEYYYAMPSGNTIRLNISEEHPWVDVWEAYWDFGADLLVNPDGICRNTWEKNQFGTGLGVPGCIGASVVLDEKDVCALHDDDD